MLTDIVILIRNGAALIDRQTLSHITGRSINTIRARCPIVTHSRGRALYDMEQSLAILLEIPQRKRTPRRLR